MDVLGLVLPDHVILYKMFWQLNFRDAGSIITCGIQCASGMLDLQNARAKKATEKLKTHAEYRILRNKFKMKT